MRKSSTTALILILSYFNYSHSQTFTNYTIADGLIDNSVSCASIDNNGSIWFGTQNGISKFDGSNWESHTTTTDSGMIDNTITSIHTTSNNDLWIGTDFGTCMYSGQNWTCYTTNEGLGDNRVKYIKEAPDGKIWFGEYDGLSIFDGSNWTTYNMSSGLPFGGIQHIEFDSNGDAWLGSGFGGLIKFDGTNFIIYNTSNGLINSIVNSITIDGQNKKWTGTATGISVFDNNNNWLKDYTQMYLLPPPDTLNPVIDLDFDSQGLLWVGIYVDYLLDGGVAMYNGFSWVDFNMSDGLIGPVITDLVIDDLDQVWITTGSGISKLTNVPALIKEQNDLNIIVYPNPTKSNFTNNNPNKSDYIVKVKNLNGEIIFYNKVNSTSIEIELNARPGLYFLEITDEKNRTYTEKIIKS